MLRRLIGRWSLERTIDGQASMRGTAGFEPTADDWIEYREEGELRLANGQRFDAERRYRYSELAGGFAVFFAETPARLFHEVTLERRPGSVLAGHASHLCARDHYRSEYLFAPDDSFSVRHEVRGPRKEYTISTVYRRTVEGGGIS